MKQILKNKFVQFGIFGFVALIMLSVLFIIIGTLFDSTPSWTTSDSGSNYAKMESAMVPVPSAGRAVFDGYADEAYETAPYIPVEPSTGPISSLETFETTSYTVSARSRDFDSLCATLKTLKENDSIHFKSLTSSTNNCYARFFVSEDQVDTVLTQFTAFKHLEIQRNTSSVTRHKEQIDSQSAVVRAQLEVVESTLNEAVEAYDEIITLARETKDATALNEAIRTKLQQIDYLSQRKISLNNQLDNYAQQAAELAERIDVVEFTANFSRSNPIRVGMYEREWESAWQQVRDEFTSTLIGITAVFIIFLFRVVQYGLYLLVFIIIMRFGWKFVKRVWRL